MQLEDRILKCALLGEGLSPVSLKQAVVGSPPEEILPDVHCDGELLDSLQPAASYRQDDIVGGDISASDSFG